MKAGFNAGLLFRSMLNSTPYLWISNPYVVSTTMHDPPSLFLELPAKGVLDLAKCYETAT